MIYLMALFLITFVLYLPILLNPEILLQRGNDLEAFFWPIFFFLKEQILQYHTIPFWNNLILSGTPLLPDPQNPLFYLPNLIFLFLPIDWGFIVSLFAHSVWGGLGIYYLAGKIFKFSPLTSFFMGSLYIYNPYMIAHLEAGHYGLILALSWIPWVVWASFSSRLFLSVALAAVYLNHLLIFLITLVPGFLLSWKKPLFFILSLMLTLGLLSLVIIPQVIWQNQTTRDLLIKFPDSFPKWETKTEFLQALIWPWPRIFSLDSEKWITLGIGTSVLSFLGFFFLKRQLQIALTLCLVTGTLILLNNLSPIYNFLISQDFYNQLRVSTRIWIVLFIIIIFLSGLALERITKWKKLIIILVLAEFLSLGWLQLLKSPPKINSVPPEVYQFLSKDQELFRVFCVTRCIPQKKAAENHLHLVEGYSTLIQKNYFEYFIQLDQVYWQQYSLSLPPLELINFRQIQPHSPTLAEYNIKYIIAPYRLKDPKLDLLRQYGDFFIYLNTIYKSRAYFINTSGTKSPQAPILHYSPNQIVVDTRNQPSGELILSEVYSPGWKAYLNGQEEVKVIEHSSKLRLVEIKPDTDKVTFQYHPPGFRKGLLLTFITLVFAGFFLKLYHST